jgi:hypothetical protein
MLQVGLRVRQAGTKLKKSATDSTDVQGIDPFFYISVQIRTDFFDSVILDKAATTVQNRGFPSPVISTAGEPFGLR